VITNFFIENSGEVELDQTIHKLLCWFYYGDDTFLTWPHRLHKLKYFLDHQNIHFTLETERGGHLSCPDTDIYRRPHGLSGPLGIL
jgi:hypothetical protein